MLLHQVFRQHDDFFVEILDGEAFLYHLSNTRIFYCNQTAVLVWQLCDGQRNGEEIVEILHEAFPKEEKDTIATDIEEALQQFLDHKALDAVTLHSDV